MYFFVLQYWLNPESGAISCSFSPPNNPLVCCLSARRLCSFLLNLSGIQYFGCNSGEIPIWTDYNLISNVQVQLSSLITWMLSSTYFWSIKKERSKENEIRSDGQRKWLSRWTNRRQARGKKDQGKSGTWENIKATCNNLNDLTELQLI